MSVMVVMAGFCSGFVNSSKMTSNVYVVLKKNVAFLASCAVVEF